MTKIVNSAAEFYEHEEKIAKNLTKEKILGQATALIQQYNDIVSQYVDSDTPVPNDLQLICQAIVVKLRGINRRSNLRTKMVSDIVDAKKKEVEKQHLVLQNLEMQVEHMQKAIEDLKAVESTSISLVPIDEFLQKRNMLKEDFDGLPDHDQLMALMSLELELRKEFVQQIEGEKVKIVEKEAELEAKESKLEDILPLITQLRKLMQPILQAVDLQVATPPYLERTMRSHYLAPQLSTLYVNVTVFNKINEKSLRFTCNGNVEDAAVFDKAQKEAANLKKQLIEKVEVLQSDDVDDEEEEELMDVDMPDSRTAREKEEEILNQFKQKQKLFQPHPISFTAQIPGESNTNLIFNYLPELDVVTVKTLLKLKATYAPFMDSETILDDLYPNDDGSELPNSSATMLQSLVGLKMSELKNIGRPYKFIQQLCTVPVDKEVEEDATDRYKFFMKTMFKIGSRIKARSILDVTYRNGSCEKYLDSLPDFMKKLIPQNNACKLGKLIPAESGNAKGQLSKKQEIIFDRLRETGQLDSGFQFICTVEQTGNRKVDAFFHIPRCYPDQSSMVLLIPCDVEKYEYLAALESLELYLNTDIPNIAQKEPELMFALQLGVLATRCEVVQDISTYNTEEGYKPVNFYFNFHKSRLNEPIFDFVPTRNAYGRTKP